MRKGKGEGSYESVAFTGMEGEFLVVHGVGVELRERIGGTAKRRVHAPIHLVQARRYRLSLLRHRRCRARVVPLCCFCALLFIRRRKKQSKV